jgi:pimeloyl-ACP methyl ester carboxylesterase
MASIVLVHGGFVDGSGWEGVYNILKNDGHDVGVVQNPTISLAGDVAATRQVIAAQKGSVILVGHSYGGAVITQAGNDPKVSMLVYITAFAPDKGESVQSLIKDPPPGAPVPPILPPQDGFLFLDREKFPCLVRGRRPEGEGRVPGRVTGALGSRGVERHHHGAGSGRASPSWYLFVTDDRMIPIAAQRMMAKRAGSTVAEVGGSHAIYVSNPKAVADIIVKAAKRREGIG